MTDALNLAGISELKHPVACLGSATMSSSSGSREKSSDVAATPTVASVAASEAGDSEMGSGILEKAHGPDSEDEAREAALLGLGAPSGPAKKKQKPSPKSSQTKEELMQQEYTKLESEILKIMQKLKEYPTDSKSMGYDIGKIDRSLTKRIQTAKDSGSYAEASDLSALSQKLAMIRETFKILQLYLPAASGIPQKKHVATFRSVLSKVRTDFYVIWEYIPPAARHLHLDACFTAELQAGSWSSVSSSMSSREQLHLAGGDAELAEQRSVSLAEKVVGYLLEDLPTELKDNPNPKSIINNKLLEALTAILAESPVELLQTTCTYLKQVIAKDAGGSATLDPVLDWLMEHKGSPIVRIFLNANMGKEFLRDAQQANGFMQTEANTVLTMQEILNEIKGLQEAEHMSSFETYDQGDRPAEMVFAVNNFIETVDAICDRFLRGAQIDQREDLRQQAHIKEVERALLALVKQVTSFVQKMSQSKIDSASQVVAASQDSFSFLGQVSFMAVGCSPQKKHVCFFSAYVPHISS